ncbi:MAG: hypothetical protein QOJ64_3159 [Acidobacteriota bacterium]|nr:hypothetical protein [Acidobacteriota bacterium]
MSSSIANPWISHREPSKRATSRLFCFPYAGGGAPIFRSWQKRVPPPTEVCAIQLPGRGARIRETPFSRMRPLVSALTDALLPLFDKPFAFFGHSMGAWVSFEVARVLKEKHEIEPFHLFVSGAWAPQVGSRETPIYDLPEHEFIDALRVLNGTPKELLESAELMALLVPVLRADFAVCETYKYATGPPLDCAVTAFGGLQDRRLSRGDLKAWSEQTTGPFAMRMLPGDHFFLHENEPAIVESIVAELGKSANNSA